jgi:hypothetical protein
MKKRGLNSSMIYLIHCKTLHKCYNASLPNATIINKIKCFSWKKRNKIPMVFFTEIEKSVYREAQKTSNSESNPEPEEQCWRNHNT